MNDVILYGNIFKKQKKNVECVICSVLGLSELCSPLCASLKIRPRLQLQDIPSSYFLLFFYSENSRFDIDLFTIILRKLIMILIIKYRRISVLQNCYVFFFCTLATVLNSTKRIFAVLLNKSANDLLDVKTKRYKQRLPPFFSLVRKKFILCTIIFSTQKFQRDVSATGTWTTVTVSETIHRVLLFMFEIHAQCLERLTLDSVCICVCGSFHFYNAETPM